MQLRFGGPGWFRGFRGPGVVGCRVAAGFGVEDMGCRLGPRLDWDLTLKKAHVTVLPSSWALLKTLCLKLLQGNPKA